MSDFVVCFLFTAVLNLDDKDARGEEEGRETGSRRNDQRGAGELKGDGAQGADGTEGRIMEKEQEKEQEEGRFRRAKGRRRRQEEEEGVRRRNEQGNQLKEHDEQ